MRDMEKVRSFIAIELPAGIKESIAGFQEKLRARNHAPVKWVEVENIHLTLKFLGNVAADSLDEICSALSKVTSTIGSFELQVDKPGVFPGWKRVRVVWLGLTGDLKSLEVLQKGVDSALLPLGFQPEKRDFTPHLTLARVREPATADERQQLGELVNGSEIDSAGRINVDSIHLMRSQLRPSGPIYSRISSFTLGQS